MDNKFTLYITLKLLVQIHQFYEIRLFTETTNQAKRKKVLGNTNSNMKILYTIRFKRIEVFDSPSTILWCVRARLCLVHITCGKRSTTYVHVCLSHSAFCLPNSTHWNPITNRCCAFYCRCGSVNGIACRILYIRTSWPIRTCDCPLPLAWTNYLLYCDDMTDFVTAYEHVSMDTNNDVKKKTEWPFTLIRLV